MAESQVRSLLRTPLTDMGLIEAIVMGLQFKGLEKPIVFITMLFGLLFFGAAGIGMVAIGVQELLNGAPILQSFVFIPFTILFFGLSWVCAYFVKRCFA